jgi:hypothetical protein
MKKEQDLKFLAEAVKNKGNYVRKALESVMEKIAEIDPGQDVYIYTGVETEEYGPLYFKAGSKDLYRDGQYVDHERLDESSWPWTLLDVPTIKAVLNKLPEKVDKLYEKLWKLSQYQIPEVLKKWIEIE